MQKVFIIGLYKSGTSWLLECLGSHPDIAAVAELDMIRAVNGVETRVFNPLPKEEVLKNIFGRSAFLNLPKQFIDEHEDTYHGSAERILASLKCGKKLDFKQVGSPFSRFLNCMLASRFQHPLVCHSIAFTSGVSRLLKPATFDDIEDQYLLDAINGIKAADGAVEMMDSFVRSIEAKFRGQRSMMVLKGADQVARFGLLEQWMPHAKKIAIVRDGRDASISAFHFRSLMRARGAAYVPKDSSTEFKALLNGWKSRAQMLIDLKGCSNLKIIRYEDLLGNFESTLTSVFSFLDVPTDKKLILEIKLRNSFRAITGRQPGKMAKDIRRAGIHGEWISTLSENEKQEAWQLAGNQLSAFGYGIDEVLHPISI